MIYLLCVITSLLLIRSSWRNAQLEAKVTRLEGKLPSSATSEATECKYRVLHVPTDRSAGHQGSAFYVVMKHLPTPTYRQEEWMCCSSADAELATLSDVRKYKGLYAKHRFPSEELASEALDWLVQGEAEPRVVRQVSVREIGGIGPVTWEENPTTGELLDVTAIDPAEGVSLQPHRTRS